MQICETNNKRQTTTIRYNSYKVESSEMVKNKQTKNICRKFNIEELAVSRSVGSEDPSFFYLIILS